MRQRKERRKGGREGGRVSDRVERHDENGPAVSAEGVTEDGGHDTVPIGDVVGGGRGGVGRATGEGRVGGTEGLGTRPGLPFLVFFLLPAGCGEEALNEWREGGRASA